MLTTLKSKVYLTILQVATTPAGVAEVVKGEGFFT
jgi:hypothetical protein